MLAGVLQLRLGLGAQAMKRAVEHGRFGKLSLCSAYLKWCREQFEGEAAGPEICGGVKTVSARVNGHIVEEVLEVSARADWGRREAFMRYRRW